MIILHHCSTVHTGGFQVLACSKISCYSITRLTQLVRLFNGLLILRHFLRRMRWNFLLLASSGYFFISIFGGSYAKFCF